jgi:hypothetical protein
MVAAVSLMLLCAAGGSVVEEFDHEVEPGKPAVHFRLELDPGHEGGGEATRLRVRAPGNRELVIDNPDGWIPYEGGPKAIAEAFRGVEAPRPGPSRFLLFARAGPGAPALALIRSYAYASDAERLHIVGFGRGGRPALVFDQQLDLEAWADLDGDGIPELVGRPCRSEVIGQGHTYAPVVVFKFPSGGLARARLSMSLSERRARLLGRAWAGTSCRSDFLVKWLPARPGEVVVDRRGTTVAVGDPRPPMAGPGPRVPVDEGAKPLLPASFAGLSSQRPVREIVERLGPAHAETGSGLCIFVWRVGHSNAVQGPIRSLRSTWRC